jgi:HKD family nuclease
LCTEAHFAIAFVKQSGMHMLLPDFKKAIKRGVKIKIIAGIDFSLTEPLALKALLRILNDKKGSELFIAEPPKATFHPKIYWFTLKTGEIIISGSANCTMGGMEGNEEISLLVDADKSSSVVDNVHNYFNDLLKQPFVKRASELSISVYEKFYNDQKQARKRIRQRPVKPSIDYKVLRQFLIQYENENDVPFLNNERRTNYQQAKKILNYFASNQEITKSEFKENYESLVGAVGVTKLWKSGSVFRHKKKTINNYKRYRELVNLIKDNISKGPAKTFELAKKFHVPGVGVNIITEMMMTFNRTNFGNLNRNPITSLKEGGCFLKDAESFHAEDYLSYCELLKEISLELGFKNMLEVDSFLNDIFWKVKGKYNQ